MTPPKKNSKKLPPREPTTWKSSHILEGELSGTASEIDDLWRGKKLRKGVVTFGFPENRDFLGKFRKLGHLVQFGGSSEPSRGFFTMTRF